MPSPPVVLHRGTQSIPSTVKADLLFTQGMIPGERRCGEKEFFLFNSVVIAPLTPPPPGIGGCFNDKTASQIFYYESRPPTCAGNRGLT
jgi:hypothetical protein